ncbi:MAG: aminotransferase class V-fold PLP-dependent enzyme [Ruminococcaceae bacterium]|nr:aminotransferase class V-fold PLP-dependent enzyme [Oscillospiraceae bacterium]
MIYFDAAATTWQKPPQVRRAVARAMERLASPGRGGYRQAREAEQMMYDCRLAAAALFGCEPEQAVFTMNATHGLNIAVKSLVRRGGRVVISGFEHNAVVRPLHAAGARTVAAGRALFDPDAVLDAFDRAITRDTDAVICTHVSNVFGFILPVEEIAGLCRARGVPLIVDASQSAGILPVSLRGLGARFIAMPGHKGLYGPQGTGLLLCAEPGEPLLSGGTGTQSRLAEMPGELPERHEAGTPNVCGIAGLRAGLDFLHTCEPGELAAHERALCRHVIRLLQPEKAVTCFSGPPACQSGVLSLRIRGLDGEEAAELLANSGVAVRAGLHCAPLAHESAGTLDGGTVRLSFSAFNSRRETEIFAETLSGLLRMNGR